MKKLELAISNNETWIKIINDHGISGNILFQIEKGTGFSYYAMTGETDIIDDKEDHWLYIKGKENNTGWIFGGYATVDGSGGYKYHRPEESVQLFFCGIRF